MNKRVGNLIILFFMAVHLPFGSARAEEGGGVAVAPPIPPPTVDIKTPAVPDSSPVPVIAPIPAAPSLPPVPTVHNNVPLPPERVLPQVEKVQGGSFSQQLSADRTSVTYTTGGGPNVVDFKSFDIERSYKVAVEQASSSSKSLFQVTGQDPSIIRGQLSINQGHVFLSNHNGVYFSKDAILDIHRLTAVGGKADAAAFMKDGDFTIRLSDLGTVFNAATVRVKDKGLFALVGHSVTNTGHILGNQITVQGVAGKEVYVSFKGHDHVAFKVLHRKEEKGLASEVQVRPVLVTLDEAESMITHVVNMGGTIAATHAETDERGHIVLKAEKVELTGQVKAPAATVEVGGEVIKIKEGSSIDVSDPHQAGTILIGDRHAKGKIEEGENPTDYVVTEKGSSLIAESTGAGPAGTIQLYADKYLDPKGKISVESKGTGDGGFLELSVGQGNIDLSATDLHFKAYNPAAKPGQFLLDPDYVLISATGGTTNPWAWGSPAPIAIGDTSTPGTLLYWLANGNVLLVANFGIGFTNSFGWTSDTDLLLKVGDDSANQGQIYLANTTITSSGKGNLYMYVNAADNSAPFVGGGTIAGNSLNHAVLSLNASASNNPAWNNITLTNINNFIVQRYNNASVSGPFNWPSSPWQGYHLTTNASFTGGLVTLGNIPANSAFIGPKFSSTNDLTGGGYAYGVNSPTTSDSSASNTFSFVPATSAGGLFLGSPASSTNLIGYLNVLVTGSSSIANTGGNYSPLINSVLGTLLQNNIFIDGGGYATALAGSIIYGGGIIGRIQGGGRIVGTGNLVVQNVNLAGGAAGGYYAGAIGYLDVGSSGNSINNLIIKSPQFSTGTTGNVTGLNSSLGLFNITNLILNSPVITTGTLVGSGSINSLGSLLTTGPLTLNQNVTTTGGQTYGGATTLGADVALTTTNNGAITFGNTLDGNKSLTTTTGTGGVTFSGAVGSGAGNVLTALTVNNSVNAPITVGASSITTSGAQTYTGNLTLTQSTTTLTGTTINLGAVTGSAGGAKNLTISKISSNDTSGNAQLNGLFSNIGTFTVGSGTPPSTSSNTTIATSSSTSPLSANTHLYYGNVILNNDAYLTGGSGGIYFNSNLDGKDDGGQSLTISPSPSTLVRFNTVGGTNRLKNLTSAGTTQLYNNITTTGAQNYNGPQVQVLQRDITLTGSSVGFSGVQVLGSGYALNVVGDASLASTLVGLGGFSVSGATTLTGNTTFNPTLSGTTYSGNIRFDGSINATTAGGQSLTADAGTGTVTLNNVGQTTALSSVALQSTNNGPITLNGDVKTAGDQTYGGAVALNKSTTTLTSTGGTVNLGPVVGNSNNLTIAGNAAFNNAINNSVNNLIVSGDATIKVFSAPPSTMTTAGDQTYNGTLNLLQSTKLAGNNISLNQANGTGFSLTVSANGNPNSGNAILNGTSLNVVAFIVSSSTGTTTFSTPSFSCPTQNYIGPVLLNNDLNLSAVSAIGFFNILNSNRANKNLIISLPAASISFFNAVGGVQPLASLTVNGNPTIQIFNNITTMQDNTTPGPQTYTGQVQINGPATLTGSTVALPTVSGSNNLNIAGDAALKGNVNITGSGKYLNVSGATTFVNNNTVTTSGTQTYGGNVTLQGNPTLTATNNNITFNGSIDNDTGQNNGLTVDAGTGIVTLNNVGQTTPLNAILVQSTNHGPISLSGNVQTAGTPSVSEQQIYDGPVTLINPVTLSTTANNGNIVFNYTVDGQALTTATNGAGRTYFNGAVGGLSLASLDVGAVTINTGTITTTGGQNYSDIVTVGADTQLTGGDSIFFRNSIDAATDGGQSLSVDAGVGSVSLSSVGQTHPLNNLSLQEANHQPILLGGDISTEGIQTYGGSAFLPTKGVSIISANNITFGTIDILGDFGLTIDSGSGTTSIGGVGTLAFLPTTLSLQATHHGPITLTGDVNTTSDQTYGGDVTINQDTALLTTGGGDINLNGKVNSAAGNNFSLTMDAGGGTATIGTIGNSQPLSALSVQATNNGPITMGGDITTQSTQTYGGPVTLGADSSVTTTTGNSNIDFKSTVDGNFGLVTSTAGTGSAIFEGVVGGTPLSYLTTGNVTISTSSITTDGNQTYTGLLKLTTDATLNAPISNTGVFITNGTSNSTGHSLTINAGALQGGAVLSGSINPISLKSLQVNGNALLSGNITTTGAQSYNTFVGIGDSTNVTASDATFSGAVTSNLNQPKPLTVTAPTILFGSTVGGSGSDLVSALQSLTLNGVATMNGNVTTIGAQTYNNVVTMVGNPVLRTSHNPYRPDPFVTGWINFAVAPDPSSYSVYGWPIPPLPPDPTDNISNSNIQNVILSSMESGESMVSDGVYSTNLYSVLTSGRSLDPADSGLQDTTFVLNLGGAGTGLPNEELSTGQYPFTPIESDLSHGTDIADAGQQDTTFVRRTSRLGSRAPLTSDSDETVEALGIAPTAPAVVEPTLDPEDRPADTTFIPYRTPLMDAEDITPDTTFTLSLGEPTLDEKITNALVIEQAEETPTLSRQERNLAKLLQTMSEEDPVLEEDMRQLKASTSSNRTMENSLQNQLNNISAQTSSRIAQEIEKIEETSSMDIGTGNLKETSALKGELQELFRAPLMRERTISQVDDLRRQM